MINYKYNEKIYAEEILKNGFLTRHHVKELKILAKYYKEIGYTRKQTEKLLYKFCDKYIPYFNEVLYFRTINNVLRFAWKKISKLIIIENIPITDFEFEYINNLDMKKLYKRTLFCLMVQDKLARRFFEIVYGDGSRYGFFGKYIQQYKEVREMAGLSSKKVMSEIFRYFNKNNIIDVRLAGRIKLLFLDEIPQSDNIIMKITTFDNTRYWFDYYNGDKKIIPCIECGKLIKLTSNRRKYCDACKKETILNYKRQLMRDMRKNKNVDI